MKNAQLLSALTASLLADLARSGAEAERQQRAAFAELAAEVAVPAEVHEERAAAAAEAYLAGFEMRRSRARKDEFVLDDASRARLRGALAGVVALIDGAELTIDDVVGAAHIDRRTLFSFVDAALRRDARQHLLQTQTLLRDGLPRAFLKGGSVKVKVILYNDDRGRIIARLANEESVKKLQPETISELTFDFGIDSFPPIG